MLLHKVGIEFKINPSWYSPFFVLWREKEHRYVRKTAMTKRREETDITSSEEMTQTPHIHTLKTLFI